MIEVRARRTARSWLPQGAPWWGLVVLVSALAALDLQWVHQLRDAEIAHMRLVARQRAEGLAREFENELGGAYNLFNTEPSTLRGDRWPNFVDEYDAWRAKAVQPGLLRDWYLVTADGDGTLRLRRFDPQERRFPPAEWTDALSPVRTAIERENCLRVSGARLEGAAHVGPEVAAPPALLVPLFTSEVAVSSGHGPAYGYVIALIDVDHLRTRFLPALSRKYFGDAAGLEYDVEVVDAADPRSIVFRSSERPSGPADVDVRFFRIGFTHLDEIFLPGGAPSPKEGIWLLRATHRDGSIAAHVARQHRRDLLVSAAVLGLLAASATLLVASARRARRLAEQQTAFVAGVSHELRTPLAVIRSAGENLADGLVSEPDRVRRYGELVAQEGRRLTQLVEHAIEFAALEGRAGTAPERIYDVAPLVEEIASRCPSNVERAIDRPLPSVKGDPNATRQVLSNLLENAQKHAPQSPVSIRVDAVEWRGRPAVRIEVADRGDGVDPSDLPHLFEPFYRGQRAQKGQVPGSGLGLSIVKRLVEQQRGSIAVHSTPGSGCTFTLRLPGA
jgi:signal transduction histidine kinase